MSKSQSVDDEYVERLRNGEATAYSYFIKTYQNMAFTLAVSIVKDEFAAQEVAQDAFLKAFKAILSFNRQSSFKTWFYKIVVNEAFMRIKSSKRDRLSFCDEYETDISDDDGLADLQEQEQIDLINRALLMMPANESLALRLFYLDDESIKSIAAITGWSEANSKVILHRARKSIRIVLNDLRKNFNA
jgi:RNA polymerase sigma factor (sigma-70 family)